MSSDSPYENREYRRNKWYFGTAEQRVEEAIRRKREWIQMIEGRLPSDYRPVCAEIGVWEGEHAWIMYHALKPSKLVLVDPFLDMNKFVGIYSANDEDALSWVKGIFSPYKEVEVLRDYSVEAAAKFPDKFFDYVYIDGIHTLEDTYEDICAWWPKISDIGCLCGHDAGSEGVMAALKKFNKPGLELSPNGTEWVLPKIEG